MNGDSSLPVGSNVMPMGYSYDITIFFYFYFFWGGGGGGGGGIVSKMNYLIAPKNLVQDDHYKTKNMVTSFFIFFYNYSSFTKKSQIFIVPF